MELLEIDLPFLVLQLHQNAQVSLPHPLDRLGDDLMILIVVVSQRDRRKALAVRIACLAQKPSGLGRVMRKSYARIMRRHTGGNPRTGGLLAAVEDLGKDAAIDGHREGLAHTHVIKRFSVRDEAVVIAPKLRHASEAGYLDQPRLFQNGDAAVIEEIELTLLVHGQGSGLLVDHEHLDFFDGGLAEKKIGIGL